MGSGLGGPWGSTRGSARRLRAGRPGAGGRAGSLEERSWRAWRWSGPGHSQGSRAGRRAAVERWRPGLRTGGELRCGTAGAGPAVAARAPRCVRQQRGAVRVAMLRSSPVRRRVPISSSPPCRARIVVSARSGSAETDLGVGSRGSLGSSPRQLQHRLHHAGAVLGAGLAKQAAVGLGVAVGGSGALVTPGALRSCCSLWPVAVRGLCGPLLPGQAAAPSCSPPASMAVTAQCPAGWKGGMGLFGAGSLRPHWLPPIRPVLSLGAKCS